MSEMINYEHGIHAVDSEYARHRFDALHVIVEGGRAAVVDTGVNRSVPLLLAALARLGLKPQQVDYVILTHVHLDHAGGAGLLMREFPEARLAVHPRGARHMIDPSKLVAGATAVYGAEVMREMYGDILPVDPGRVLEMGDDSTLDLNGRELRFFDTPGHARHHMAMRDGRSGHFFTGDTFGLSYRQLDRDGRQFVIPTTSPVQFEPDAMHRTIDLIAGHEPEAVYVTHYSQVRDISRIAADLHRLVDAHVELALSVQDAGAARHGLLREGVTGILRGEAQRYGWMLPEEEWLDLLEMDIELNAQGLACWLDSMKRA